MSAATAPTAPMAAAVSCQPLRCAQRASLRNGGATKYPGDHHPGSLMAPSRCSSQCFAFQRCQCDFFSITRLSAQAEKGA